MHERLECEVLQKARYINTLTFTCQVVIDYDSRLCRPTTYDTTYLKCNQKLTGTQL